MQILLCFLLLVASAYCAPTTVDPTASATTIAAWEQLIRFIGDVEKSVVNLDFDYLAIYTKYKLELVNTENVALYEAQIEKALTTVAKLEKLIQTTLTTKHLNLEETTAKQMLATLEDLKKKFNDLESQLKSVTGTPKAKPKSTTPK